MTEELARYGNLRFVRTVDYRYEYQLLAPLPMTPAEEEEARKIMADLRKQFEDQLFGNISAGPAASTFTWPPKSQPSRCPCRGVICLCCP